MDDDYQNMVIVGLEETITALKAERDSLREALKPFANYACGCGGCHNCIAKAALEVKDEL